MPDTESPTRGPDPDAAPRGPVAFAATALALAGGLTLVATALLSTTSVLLRWATGRPIAGDFELVSIGSGLGVLGFLAYGTLTRANILVDTFMARLPPRAQQTMDAFWTLVWAAITLLLAERMARGALETLRSGTTTMVLSLPTWWVVGVGALCFAATSAAAAHWVARLARGRA
jgi:TRAP-type C4-dicarboxylate transport system permease small subunit